MSGFVSDPKHGWGRPPTRAGGDNWTVLQLPSNLRWLCRSCHRAKTSDDRARLADLRRAKTAPTPATIDGQQLCWDWDPR